jgi:hypothetical protein
MAITKSKTVKPAVKKRGRKVNKVTVTNPVKSYNKKALDSIGKSVTLPNSFTKEDIEKITIDTWRKLNSGEILVGSGIHITNNSPTAKVTVTAPLGVTFDSFPDTDTLKKSENLITAIPEIIMMYQNLLMKSIQCLLPKCHQIAILNNLIDSDNNAMALLAELENITAEMEKIINDKNIFIAYKVRVLNNLMESINKVSGSIYSIAI